MLKFIELKLSNWTLLLQICGIGFLHCLSLSGNTKRPNFFQNRSAATYRLGVLRLRKHHRTPVVSKNLEVATLSPKNTGLNTFFQVFTEILRLVQGYSMEKSFGFLPCVRILIDREFEKNATSFEKAQFLITSFLHN